MEGRDHYEEWKINLKNANCELTPASMDTWHLRCFNFVNWMAFLRAKFR